MFVVRGRTLGVMTDRNNEKTVHVEQRTMQFRELAVVGRSSFVHHASVNNIPGMLHFSLSCLRFFLSQGRWIAAVSYVVIWPTHDTMDTSIAVSTPLTYISVQRVQETCQASKKRASSRVLDRLCNTIQPRKQWSVMENPKTELPLSVKGQGVKALSPDIFVSVLCHIY